MKHLLSIIAFLMVGTVSFGQTYINDKPLIQESSLDSSNEQLNVILNESITKTVTGSSIFSGNTVFIAQAGFNNIGSVEVASNNSRVRLLQIGSNNEAQINLRAVTIRENVVQLGNDNFFRDYSQHGAVLHTANIFQDGSYNKIISTGKNSLSEKINITQNGIGKEVYIIHN